MATARAKTLPTPESIASYVARNAEKVKNIQEQSHEHAMQSVREATYNGHRIVVRTHYEIEVDGKRVTGHLGVTNDGQVHYHPVPNASFPSAVELVERLIDIFPDDFKKKRPPSKKTGGSRPEGEHDAHRHALETPAKAKRRQRAKGTGA
jgi:hypothetical protein